MKPTTLRLALAAALLAAGLLHPAAAGAKEPAKPRSAADLEAATRLQVFLDRANFAPGKIDGRYGEFTVRALALYRQSQGAPAPAETAPAPAPADAASEKKDAAPAKAVPAPDTTGLDLASVEPLFIDYPVTETDLQSVGELPDEVPAQAKLKSLPYKTAAEAIAEKFHSDVDFIAELNPGKTAAIKAGDVLRVPNVEPFDLSTVKDLKPGSETAATATTGANEADDTATDGKTDADPDAKKDDAKKDASEAKPSKKKDGEPAAPTTLAVKVDTKSNMLSVYDGEKVIAAYPVTIGSSETASPLGEWKVRGVAKNPNFRYDKAMLNKGERSSDFHMLPPGPNNPVGVLWIALNKKGIGLHGTSDPDAIGRSASHGCIRLANWDIVRLAGKVRAGVPVSIH